MRHSVNCVLTNELTVTTTLLVCSSTTSHHCRWGTPGISGWGGGNDYDLATFHSKLNNSNYMAAAASWSEQRIYNALALAALEEANHPLFAEAQARSVAAPHRKLVAYSPAHSKCTPIDTTQSPRLTLQAPKVSVFATSTHPTR